MSGKQTDAAPPPNGDERRGDAKKIMTEEVIDLFFGKGSDGFAFADLPNFFYHLEPLARRLGHPITMADVEELQLFSFNENEGGSGSANDVCAIPSCRAEFLARRWAFIKGDGTIWEDEHGIVCAGNFVVLRSQKQRKMISLPFCNRCIEIARALDAGKGSKPKPRFTREAAARALDKFLEKKLAREAEERRAGAVQEQLRSLLGRN
jgi:hypothetical protein